MKGKLLTFLLLALLLSSCTNSELPEETPDMSSPSTEGMRYLGFNISQYQNIDTRSDNDGDWNLESGSAAENRVNRIFFYFFDNEGHTVNVMNGTDRDSRFKDAYEWRPSESNITESNTSPEGSSDNIEKFLSGTLAVRFEDDIFPEQMLTVVNPSYELASFPIANISELQGKVLDLYTGLTESNFVMTNSVYVDSSIVCATPVGPENICFSKQEAYQNSVDIYVERGLARIDLRFSMDKAPGISVPEGVKAFKTSCVIKREGETNETEIFVKFLGWAVTSTPTTSDLFKQVDTSWNVDNFFSASSSWNSSSLHRSAWGVNPAGVEYQWYSYDDLTDPAAEFEYGNTFRMNVSTGYMQENANPYSEGTISVSNPVYPSKVIFAAQIVDGTGNFIEIAEYEGKYYRVEDLKTLIAGKLDMWYADGKDNEGNNIYSQINQDHLSFETSMEHNKKSGPGEKDTYYVYFTLSDEGKNRTWYHYFVSEDEKDSNIIANPQSYIDSMTAKAKVWTEGYAYYYFDIPHCPDIEAGLPGSLGVVRNNLYGATIEEVTKLGTPVYKPGEMIYPETPESTVNPLVVTVRKLGWRKEHQDVQLSW